LSINDGKSSQRKKKSKPPQAKMENGSLGINIGVRNISGSLIFEVELNRKIFEKYCGYKSRSVRKIGTLTVFILIY
jgi:hypothetical protein